MTELDNKLKELAKTDWEEFLRIVVDDSILIAKARLLREDGKSYRQISIKIGMTPAQVRHAVNKDDKK